MKARKGQNQHEELVTQRDGLQQKVAALEASQTAAQSALSDGTNWASKIGGGPAAFANKATASLDTGQRTVA